MESFLILIPVTSKDLRLYFLSHQQRQHTSKPNTYQLIRPPQCYQTQVVVLVIKIILTEDLNRGKEEESRMNQHLLTI